MNDVKQRYAAMQADAANRAAQMKATLIRPQMDGDSFISDKAERNNSIKSAIRGSIFESLGGSAGLVVGASANALRAYTQQRGHVPSDEVLANAHKAIENLVSFSGSDVRSGTGIFESAGSMNNSEGIILRDHMAALVMPVMLQTITSDMVTTCQANYDRSEIFRVFTKAGSTFGELHQGDVINETFNGQYGTLDQRKLAGTGDGTATTFTLNVGMPLKRSGSQAGGYVKVYLDKEKIAEDNGQGSIFGAGLSTSTVNYDTGVITVAFLAAPASGLEVHIAYDVNIEKRPDLIPTIEHEIKSWTIVPHEGAIRGEVSLQALYSAQREYSIDMSGMTLNSMRNVLAADKDRKRLRDMWFFAKGSTEWNMTVPSGASYYEHYETVRETLKKISTDLVQANLRSGLVGVVAGNMACNVLSSLRAPHFVPAANYREIPQPHYVGRLFGMWDLYKDPAAPNEWEALCFARGTNSGEAGYVAADAIPAVPLKHPVGTDMHYRDTLWELAYRDLHPYDGRNWFTILRVTAV